MNNMINQILPEIELYSLNSREKKSWFIKEMANLFGHHYENSPAFRSMMNALNHQSFSFINVEDFPFIPVRLFKLFELLSVPKSEVVKTMTSSGTSGQSVSKIFLDKQTSLNQTRILSRIVSSFAGSSRVPMIIIDAEATVKNRNIFSARAAGITGFSIFASKRIFALNDDMTLNVDIIKEFVNANNDKPIMLFGFTYIVYKHFIQQLESLDQSLDLSKALLFHGGGWKKMESEKIDNYTFKKQLKKLTGLERVHDYYGMVEQTGTIYVECEEGFLHTTEYSEVIIRDAADFSPCQFGQLGLIQLLSLLPYSYPGQSILTEDLGVIFGEDDCNCGRRGKYFKINGRLKNAELRGCSDTYGESIK